MPVTSKVRREILRECKYRSELSGDKERPLEVCHMDHDYDHEDYNSHLRTVLCTDIEHFAFHALFRNNPGRIGLNFHSNEFAMRKLSDRINMWNRKNGYDYGFKSELREAILLWGKFLGIEG